ncbi:isoaspartyl peptidase/L-asparaginase [bacterium]|nr:isoaspartyl peptidase/L-asparaginase [bacterium]
MARKHGFSPVLIVHGGAGQIKYRERHRRGIARSLAAGYVCLERGGSALDAVVAAVSMLESISVFNAGTGSVPSLTGQVEMDAAVMTDDGRSGAVAAISRVEHPVVLAREVMIKTDHRLLVGQGATLFARKLGYPDYEPLTDERVRFYQRTIKKITKTQKMKFFPRVPNFLKMYCPGTVGAVARDNKGALAVATSTGGMFLHLPGRVGDSPIIGAGTYASKAGAVSLTGHGEAICGEMAAFRLVTMLEQDSAPVAARRLITRLERRKCSCGLICIDARGRIGHAFNTPSMSWGVTRDNKTELFA